MKLWRSLFLPIRKNLKWGRSCNGALKVLLQLVTVVTKTLLMVTQWKKTLLAETQWSKTVLVETQWSEPNIRLYLRLWRSKHSWLSSELCQHGFDSFITQSSYWASCLLLLVHCFVLYVSGFLNLDWVLLYAGSFYFLELQFPHCYLFESKSLCR